METKVKTKKLHNIINSKIYDKEKKLIKLPLENFNKKDIETIWNVYFKTIQKNLITDNFISVLELSKIVKKRLPKKEIFDIAEFIRFFKYTYYEII